MTERYSKKLEELNEAVALIASFIKAPGYSFFISYIEESLKAKREELIAPPGAGVSSEVRTYVAGEVRAMEFVRDVMQKQLTVLNSEIEVLQRAEAEIDAEEQT